MFLAFIRTNSVYKLFIYNYTKKNTFEKFVYLFFFLKYPIATVQIACSEWIYMVKACCRWYCECHKARFMARGFSYRDNIEHEETFTPIILTTLMLKFITGFGCAAIFGPRQEQHLADTRTRKIKSNMLITSLTLQKPKNKIYKKKYVC